MLRSSKKPEEEEENVFWVTMSDLLLGLTMVFMTLFAFAMTGFSQNKITQQQAQSKVAKELAQKMQEKKINVQIDNMTGEVKISDVDLFDVGSYELSNNGKVFLNKFFPIYVETIFSNPKLADKIVSVVIQGHTDSQMFQSASSPQEQFTKNMDLSLKRANSVEDYIFNTAYDKKYTGNLTKTLMVEGKSYTEPILVNGKEDYAKSRRVEIKLVVKDSSVQNFLFQSMQPSQAASATK